MAIFGVVDASLMCVGGYIRLLLSEVFIELLYYLPFFLAGEAFGLTDF